MKEWITENWIQIMTYAFMFLVGVGVGGAITELIWKGENE